MNYYLTGKKIMMNIISHSLLALLFCAVVCGPSYAVNLIARDVASGYDNCSMVDNGDGTSSAFVTINYKAVTNENTGGRGFTSRGLLFYSYDRLGQPQSRSVKAAYMNNVRSLGAFKGNGYMMYHSGGSSGAWKSEAAIVVNVEMIFPNAYLQDWNAVTIRAGNYTPGDDVGEITGGAYISGGEEAGFCKVVVDPLHPPEPNISLGVSVPDWDLGEIKRGEQSVPFSASKDQLCLKYSDVLVTGKPFIISASSQNGEVGSHFQLINQDDATQVIPYQLALDSGSQHISLPNQANKPFPLHAGGKTCFMPTFKTSAPKSIKKGDYRDVLTFNIITKS